MTEPRLDPIRVAAAAVDAARQAGAEQAEAYVQFATQLDIQVRNGAVERVRRAAGRGVGLRATHDGRTAMVHTTDVAGIPMLQMAARVVEIARALPAGAEVPIYALPGAVEPFPHPDPGLSAETLERRIGRLQEIERAMLAVAGVSRSGGASWSETDGEIALVNTSGLSLYAPFCVIENAAEAIAERDGESYPGGRQVELPARTLLPVAEAFGREAGHRATEMLGARSLASTRAPVVFTPRTGWTLLASLGGALRGDHVVRGRSYLAGRLGERLAAPGVTLRDNPHRPASPGRRAFDAEGTPTRDLALVREGRLEAYLTDLKSAAALGVAPGGHATRGSHAEGTEIGPSLFYMEPGPHTPEQILAECDRALLVTQLSGWWVGLSPAHDQFSSAAMGIWIEKGEPAYPVRGITIAGSLGEMLAGIDRVGNDLEFTNRTTTPTFRVAEMAISGI
ncbi:MAG: TldD/PmbA family protein [Candidatus Eisenbacteria bacterium]|uniref:TldD/PmbA family protein n=1 Tax=Eiseniibacteriota bacterium TaxID=2212470 RepID=A0A938BQI0_UNCEI|nr:TldD/PmbA family protein [Candidatus Eisenbacteria bacterium]